MLLLLVWPIVNLSLSLSLSHCTLIITVHKVHYFIFMQHFHNTLKKKFIFRIYQPRKLLNLDRKSGQKRENCIESLCFSFFPYPFHWSYFVLFFLLCLLHERWIREKKRNRKRVFSSLSSKKTMREKRERERNKGKKRKRKRKIGFVIVFSLSLYFSLFYNAMAEKKKER